MQRLTSYIGNLPTTNLRIVVTLLLVTGTAVRYWWGMSWEPSVSWLAFLGAMSGIDAIQFTQKRLTHWHPAQSKPVDEILPTDEEKG